MWTCDLVSNETMGNKPDNFIRTCASVSSRWAVCAMLIRELALGNLDVS